MPEQDWSHYVRQYEEIARNLGMPNDTCFIDMEQGCHAGKQKDGHACACLGCIRDGRAFEEND